MRSARCAPVGWPLSHLTADRGHGTDTSKRHARRLATHLQSLKRGYIVVCSGRAGVLAGTKRVHVPGRAGIRGQARPRAAPSDTTRLTFSERIAERETCKRASSVVFTGE